MEKSLPKFAFVSYAVQESLGLPAPLPSSAMRCDAMRSHVSVEELWSRAIVGN